MAEHKCDMCNKEIKKGISLSKWLSARMMVIPVLKLKRNFMLAPNAL